jgi:hypothetical protein
MSSRSTLLRLSPPALRCVGLTAASRLAQAHAKGGRAPIIAASDGGSNSNNKPPVVRRSSRQLVTQFTETRRSRTSTMTNISTSARLIAATAFAALMLLSPLAVAKGSGGAAAVSKSVNRLDGAPTRDHRGTRTGVPRPHCGRSHTHTPDGGCVTKNNAPPIVRDHRSKDAIFDRR